MAKETKTKKIEAYLRKQITDGVWKKGDVLPQSKALAKKLNASEFILREAMLPLIREGILGRRPRVGTYVLSEKQVIKGKILILGVNNIQYSGNNSVWPDYISKEIEILKQKGIDYKTSISTNSIPLKEFVSQLQIDNSYFMRGVIGVINNISFLPNSVIKTLGVPTINFSNYISKKETEIIFDLGNTYFYSLNLLSLKSNNICIFRNDYKAISLLEGEDSKKRNQQLEENIKPFKDHIIEDIQIDFYNQSYINIYNIFKETIKKNPKIDALFIAEPTFIPAIHHAIIDMKLNIPKDLRIICITIESMLLGIDLHWTRFEVTDGIELAIDNLTRKIKGENIRDKIIIYPKLIKGNSYFE